MNEAQLQELLADMPFDDAEKAEILAKLRAGAAPLAIMDIVDAKLKQQREKLTEENPQEAAAYEKAYGEYVTEVDAAAEAFNTEASRIEAEMKKLEDETSATLQAERMKEVQEEIAATP